MSFRPATTRVGGHDQRTVSSICHSPTTPNRQLTADLRVCVVSFVDSRDDGVG